ncbi:transcriptional regulator family: C2H2 zinc finger [Penicillium malachiteum]|nr:transcriptional regulator family: C2H2 zinc finger [Penicillium malachiteum]
MSVFNHPHWEDVYYASSPSYSHRPQASSYETQPLVLAPMAPMQNDTLNNLYYPFTAHPNLHTEHKYYPATRLEDESASYPFDPMIQSGHVDQMRNVQDLRDPVYMAGASLDYTSRSRYPSEQGGRVPYKILDEVTMDESKSASLASGSQPVKEVSEAQSYFNITQPDEDGIEDGMYHCLWLGCTNKHGFTKMLSLWRHIKATHIHPEAFKCAFPSCEKRYGRLDTLQAHQRAVGHSYDSWFQQFDPTRSPS